MGHSLKWICHTTQLNSISAFLYKKTEMILEINKEYIYMDKFEHIVVWVLLEIGLSIFLEFVRALIII